MKTFSFAEDWGQSNPGLLTIRRYADTKKSPFMGFFFYKNNLAITSLMMTGGSRIEHAAEVAATNLANFILCKAGL